MGITARHYIFADDGSLKRVPGRVADNMVFGRDRIPEYAGTRQKVATAMLRNRGAKPTALLDLQGYFWVFDEEGRIDGDIRNNAFHFLDLSLEPDKSTERVVDLTPVIRKRDYWARNRWEPTKDQWDRVAADIWPGFEGIASDVTVVKGTVPKKPPLTSDAEYALQTVRKKLSDISSAIDELSEAALKGLAFELRRTGTYESEVGLWNGVATECDRLLELARRKRTGKGVWYAVIEATTTYPDRDYGEIHVIAHEKCAGKKAAVEAARRLLKENADAFSEISWIEAAVRSELEWEPNEAR